MPGTSSRSAFVSAALAALLYLIISSVLFYIFNERISFSPFFNFDWVKDVLGTVIMGVCVLLLELVRNAMGKKKETS